MCVFMGIEGEAQAEPSFFIPTFNLSNSFLISTEKSILAVIHI